MKTSLPEMISKLTLDQLYEMAPERGARGAAARDEIARRRLESVNQDTVSTERSANWKTLLTYLTLAWNVIREILRSE